MNTADATEAYIQYAQAKKHDDLDWWLAFFIATPLAVFVYALAGVFIFYQVTGALGQMSRMIPFVAL